MTDAGWPKAVRDEDFISMASFNEEEHFAVVPAEWNERKRKRLVQADRVIEQAEATIQRVREAREHFQQRSEAVYAVAGSLAYEYCARYLDNILDGLSEGSMAPSGQLAPESGNAGRESAPLAESDPERCTCFENADDWGTGPGSPRLKLDPACPIHGEDE